MAQLTEAQEKAVKAGTHVIDPVHGFVPALPIGATTVEGGKVVAETVTPAPDSEGLAAFSESDVLKAEAAAVKETEKGR